MADKDLWTTFEKSGSIVDYLSYKGIHVDEKGEDTVDSECYRDRDDTVRDTNW